MHHWLIKEEPSHYAFADLVRERRTDWNGVHNALALRHLRAMAPGDDGLYYHTGTERACVGIVRICSVPRPDPTDDRGSWTVELCAVRPLPRPVSLAEMRLDPTFVGFDLLRISRLSVLPVPDPMWRRILARSRSVAPTTGGLAVRGRGSGRPPDARGASRRR